MRAKHSSGPGDVPLIAGFLPVTEVDWPVRRLVRLLNRLPGCSTLGSCGGHPEPSAAQVAEGHWYVDLAFAPTRASWYSLTVLAWLCDPSTGTTMTPWAEGADDMVRFDLRGTHLAGLTLEANLTGHFEWYFQQQAG